MKVTLRIPTKEQFAFIELVVEDENLAPEEIKNLYDEYTKLVTGDSGMPELAFCHWVESIVNSNFNEWGSVNEYERLSDRQKSVIQSLKRYYKRTNQNN